MSEASKTPWRYNRDNGTIRNASGKRILDIVIRPGVSPTDDLSDEETDEIGNLVYRAVNAHDALLAAAKNAEKILAGLDKIRHLDANFNGLDELRSAIKLAEGRE